MPVQEVITKYHILVAYENVLLTTLEAEVRYRVAAWLSEGFLLGLCILTWWKV